MDDVFIAREKSVIECTHVQTTFRRCISCDGGAFSLVAVQELKSNSRQSSLHFLRKHLDRLLLPCARLAIRTISQQ